MHAAPLASSADERRTRVELGDWQTPPPLAEAVLDLVGRLEPGVRAVLEPTCGTGTFLAAAQRAYPGATLVGFDREAARIADAERALAGSGARLEVRDFFATDFPAVLGALPEPVLLLGNPPWVTSTTLGLLAAANLPRKGNFKRESGITALTGKSNFDISEWMLLRLLEAARGRRFVLAMLCKAAVVRRILEESARRGWVLDGAVYGIDAKAHFSASVAAVLLVVRGNASTEVPLAVAGSEPSWAVYPSLAAPEPSSFLGVAGGRLVADREGYAATADLEGPSQLVWRSGLKHDLARVMELREVGAQLRNGLGETVELERDYLYPLCKGSDLAHGRDERRFVLVTQTKLGDDTAPIRERAPATWRYLERHRVAFEARKSRIYRRQPPFALFGIGAYAFAPYKVAISGLYKRFTFRVLGPRAGRPVMLDDTAYFLPCSSLLEAERLARALSSPLAVRFFEARVFWDAMRPITKALLGSLSLDALCARLDEAAG